MPPLAFLPSFFGMLCCLTVSEVYYSRRSLLAQIEEARRLDLVESQSGAGSGAPCARTSLPVEPWPECLPEDAGESAFEKDL